jgi:hypothetical protein
MCQFRDVQVMSELTTPRWKSLTPSLLLSVFAPARHGHTVRKATAHACRLLVSAATEQQIGVIVSGVREDSEVFYDYFGYEMAPYAPTLENQQNA